MEFVHTNVIVDPDFVPSLDLSYLQYFTRAMKFAQTNYSSELIRRQKAHFHSLSPTHFFEEYIRLIINFEENTPVISQWYPQLTQKIMPLYQSFWDSDRIAAIQEVRNSILPILQNEAQCDAIIHCASIVSQGIKLFQWDFYRKNYLNSPEKLCALPMVNASNSIRLAKNIGIDVSENRIQKLADHWGFENSQALCQTIQKNYPLPPKIIELILWYTVCTFSPNLVKP